MQLEGQIGEIDVIERLVELWHERFTGAFRFEQDGVIKIIYFKTGDVLSASTNDRTDSIDEILLRAGKITREHIKQALAKRKENETLGDALLNLGFITRKELTWARRVQVIGIVRSIRGWDNGSYTGVADYLPKREEGTLFPMPQILLELIVTDTDRSKFEKAMEGGSAVFTRSADFDDAYAKLGLNQDADDIVNEIDGFKTAADIVASSGKDAFNVYKLLEALRILGLVQRIERSPGTPEVSFDDFAAAGVADASEAWSSNHGSSSDAPHFELDDTPPIVVTPPPPIPAPPPPPEPEPEWSAPPVWQPAPEMETPTHADVPLAAPTPAPPLQPEEPQWGFDEAQIETARRAAVPVRASEPVPPPIPPAKPKKTKSGGGSRLVFPLIWIVVVAASAYAGWWYWNSRQAAQPVPQVVKRPAKKPVIPATPPPVVASTVTTTTATTSTTTTQPVTATTASVTPPPPTPMHVTATAAPAPQTTHLERTPAGATTITNTTTSASAAAPSTDPLRAKYDGMAKEASANTSGAYTVQFELVCETASVTRALRDGGSSVWLSTAPYKGRNCYRVFWGRYATQQEASAAIASIPASLREGSKATVVKIPR